MTIPKIAEIKNEWLFQQVDVEFPTKESIAGLEVYKASLASRQYQPFDADVEVADEFKQDDIFLVDFHRLTVMFALVQASQWQEQSDRDLILEFLSQIIYSEPCSLYLGFSAGEPVAAAIVTHAEQSVLISDVVVKSQPLSEPSFIAGLCRKLDLNASSDVWVESCCNG